MDPRRPPVPPAAVDALRRTVEGLVAYPTDTAYGAALAGHLVLGVRPDVVVVPAHEAAVRATVDVVRTHGLLMTGTHTEPVTAAAAGAAPLVLLLTHRLDHVLVDPDGCTATAGPAATWTDLDRHARAAHLAAPPSSGSARSAGATVVDSVRAGTVELVSARVVRSDGFVHVVDDVEQPAADPGAWVLTAVAVRLHRRTGPAAASA